VSEGGGCPEEVFQMSLKNICRSLRAKAIPVLGYGKGYPIRDSTAIIFTINYKPLSLSTGQGDLDVEKYK